MFEKIIKTLPLIEKKWEDLDAHQKKIVWQQKHWLNFAMKLDSDYSRIHYSPEKSGIVAITARWWQVTEGFEFLYQRDTQPRIDYTALRTLLTKDPSALKQFQFDVVNVLGTYDGLKSGQGIKIKYPQGHNPKDLDFQSILEFEFIRGNEWVKRWVLREEYENVSGYGNRLKTISSHSNDYSAMPE